MEALDLLVDLNADRVTTIVMVLHDLNLAARYADHLVALTDGRVHSAGTPETVRAVFGIDSRVIPDPTSGRPLMLPLGRHRIVGGSSVVAGAVADVAAGAGRTSG